MMYCIILWKTNLTGPSSVSYLNPAAYLSGPYLFAFPHTQSLNLKTRSSPLISPCRVLPLVLFSPHLPLSAEVIRPNPTPDSCLLCISSPVYYDSILLSPLSPFPKEYLFLCFPDLVTFQKISQSSCLSRSVFTTIPSFPISRFTLFSRPRIYMHTSVASSLFLSSHLPPMDPYVVPSFYRRYQANKFHHYPWTASRDGVILGILVTHLNQWVLDDMANHYAIHVLVRLEAIDHVGDSFAFPLETCLSKLKEWWHRFYLYHWVISFPWVIFNAHLRIVRCLPHVWRALKQVRTLIVFACSFVAICDTSCFICAV